MSTDDRTPGAQVDQADPRSPLFSVVIPVYNRAATICDTIRTVLNQSFGDFEIIVVDDGSTDDPLEAIGALDDPRIRVVHQENAGGGSARNRGIDEAQGAYVAFLDSDDFFMPHKLETVAGRLDGRRDCVWYSYGYVDRGVGRYWVRPNRPIRNGEDVGEYLFVHNQFIQTSAIVLPRALAHEIRFDGTLRKGQDLDFCLRLQHAGAVFRMIEDPLIIWVDASEVGRTSRVPGYLAPLSWLDRCGHLLSRRALLGYRATVLAYYMAGDKPFTVARDLAAGLLQAGVPPRVILRQALRAYLPRGVYRRMVDTMVWAMGNARPGRDRTRPQ